MLDTLSESQREQLRADRARQIHAWAKQQVWDLCDDIAGRGATDIGKMCHAEVKAYARGQKNTLHAILERFEGGDLAIQTMIDGALGELTYRQESGRTPDYERRMFGNLAAEIRAHRVAMIDDAVTFDYPRWSGWQKKLWSIERKGVAQGEWDEFQRLQHELAALWSLSDWLLVSDEWRRRNWEGRKRREVQVAA